MEGDSSLPVDDKLAQLTRAAYGAGILCHVPAGCVLEEPIVIRWSVGRANRGLLSRTVVILEEGAQAKVLEELDESAARPSGDTAQSLWAGTSEVSLGAAAVLALSGSGWCCAPVWEGVAVGVLAGAIGVLSALLVVAGITMVSPVESPFAGAGAVLCVAGAGTAGR